MNLKGLKILITAGPTTEMWDDVRCLSNLSTGKMGFALGSESLRAGGETTVISGIKEPAGFPAEVIRVCSARDMFKAVKKKFHNCHIFISSAAVCDFRPERIKGKIDKSNPPEVIRLKPNPDILQWAGANKGSRVIAGFSLQKSLCPKKAERKMRRKKCDIMFVNTPENIANNRRNFILLTGKGQESYSSLSLEKSALKVLELCLKIKKSC